MKPRWTLAGIAVALLVILPACVSWGSRRPMLADLAVVAVLAFVLVLAVAAARWHGRRVAARVAAERADEMARREWSAVFNGPRRPGEVYA